MGFSKREMGCLGFALAVHALLFLWKGGILELPKNQDIGDMIAQVGYMSEVPSWEEAGGGGGGTEVKKTFFEKMKSIVKGDQAPAKKMEAAPPTLVEKRQLKGFSGLVNKQEVDIAVGQTKQVVVTPSQGNFEKTKPNLKENQFKVATKDVAFKIASPKSQDALANVNAIPINVGNTTSNTIKSLDGGPGSGAALQTKSLASKGSSGGFSSSFKGNSSSGGLATGGGSSTIDGAGGIGMGSDIGSGGGSGGGTGGGRGSGTGTGTGAGFGSGRGGGHSFGGTGFGNGTGMAALPRNTVLDLAATKLAKSGNFSIIGALANRKILQKTLPVYELDARVGLRFCVDVSGRVLEGILVEISSGSPTFDQKVMAAVKQWLFAPLSNERSNEIQEGVITILFRGV
jgi:TonB family protein